MMNKLFLSLSLLSAIAFTSTAQAQYAREFRGWEDYASPEHFGFDLHVGMYIPRAQTAGGESVTDSVFDGDKGPMLHLELAYFPYRIPYVGLIGPGVALGWSRYSAPICADADCSSQLDEDTSLTLWPVSPQLVLRVDVLARELDFPLVVSGKLGADIIFYSASGGGSSGGGTTIGFRWAVQLALELDFISRSRANILDEEFGINHTTLFFELYGSQAKSTIDLGTNLAWAIGLGMTF